MKGDMSWTAVFYGLFVALVRQFWALACPDMSFRN
jgi:hypothetical protein